MESLWATLTSIASAPLYVHGNVKEQEKGQEDQTGSFDRNFQKNVVRKIPSGLQECSFSPVPIYLCSVAAALSLGEGSTGRCLEPKQTEASL